MAAVPQPAPGRGAVGADPDVLGQRRHAVISQQTGIVMCIRAFNRVLAGDSLMAVMETDPKMVAGTVTTG